MTIEELLAEAQRYAKLAAEGRYEDTRRGIYAQIAQACAQTAQAMILHDATSAGTDYNGQPMLVFRTEQLC